MISNNHWIALLCGVILTNLTMASTCTETASASGQDDGPTVTTISSFPCTSGGAITGMTLDATIGTWCPSWYTYDIIINGSTVLTGQCNQTALDLSPYFPITSVAISSVDADAWSDFITLDLTLNITYTSGPMAYSSCTTTQNSNDVSACSGNQQIIGIEVITTGDTSPLDCSSIRLRTNGSTDPTNDISLIEVFYTGTSSTFATTNLYGSAAPQNTGVNIDINGVQTLASGTNYFWIAYDLAPGATAANNLDTRCQRITVDGVNRTPTTQAPGGNRTIVACSVSPGGVSNSLTAWFDGGEGTSTTTNGAGLQTWTNQATNAGLPNITQSTSSLRPIFRSNDINFNPAISFDGVDDYLYQSSTLGSDVFHSSDNTILMVHRVTSGIVYFKWEHTTNNTDRIGFEYSGGNVRFDFPTSDAGDQLIGSETYSTTGELLTAHTGNSTSTIRVNGSVDATSGNSGSMGTGVSREFIIGNNPTNNPLPTRCDYSEMIIYNRELDGGEMNVVESYLAIKYGITLGTNGTSTDYNSVYGTTVWDISTNSGYCYDITGIGREDNSNLDQQKSQTINESGGNKRDILIVANGSSLTSPSSFSADQSYFIWGHNDGALQGTWQNPFFSTTNSETIESLFNRRWKAQETGTVSDVRMQFDMSAVPGVGGTAGNNDLANLRLLVDADGDFTSGALSISPSTYNNTTDLVEFQHDFAGGTGFFFTLGSTDHDDTPLPIEMVHYTATPNSNHTSTLHWVTASEQEVEKFIVEKSEDGFAWELLAKEEPVGGLYEETEYTIIDESPFSTTNYYRLSELSLDGDIGYQEIRTVTFENEFKVNILPNPNSGAFYIQIEDQKNRICQLEIFDLSGKRIKRIENLETGQYWIDLQNVAEGMYHAKLTTHNGDFVSQLFSIQ